MNEKTLLTGVIIILLSIILGVSAGMLMSNGRVFESVHHGSTTKTVALRIQGRIEFPVDGVIEVPLKRGIVEIPVRAIVKMPVDQVVNVPVTGEPS